MNDAALILFFRHPKEGRVKTRLARDVGDSLACGLYRSFLEDILSMSREVEADKIVAVDEPEESKGLFPGYRTIRQRGGDLGERMIGAFEDAFGMGFRRCALIGGDCPDLPPAYVARSLMELDRHDLVLGPSNDGGYYLIALKSNSIDPSLFAGIPWGTERVLEETLQRTKSAGMTHNLLREWRDIDTLEDLRIFHEMNSTRGRNMRTMRFIDEKSRLLSLIAGQPAE